MADASQILFEVEKVLKKRKSRRGKEVLVKWKGYSSKFNSWEPEKNLQDTGTVKPSRRSKIGNNGTKGVHNKIDNKEETKGMHSVESPARRTGPISKLNISNVKLKKCVEELKDELERVRSGTEHSDRHANYMEGGRARRLRNQGTLLGFVADDQEHVIMDTLLTMFPCDDVDKSLIHVDYLTRVMLPESILRLGRVLEKEKESSWPTPPESQKSVVEDSGSDHNLYSSEDEWLPKFIIPPMVPVLMIRALDHRAHLRCSIPPVNPAHLRCSIPPVIRAHHHCDIPQVNRAHHRCDIPPVNRAHRR